MPDVILPLAFKLCHFLLRNSKNQHAVHQGSVKYLLIKLKVDITGLFITVWYQVSILIAVEVCNFSFPDCYLFNGIHCETS